MPKDCKINPMGKVVAEHRKIRLKKDEDINWVALSNGGPWTITFDKKENYGSPFNESAFTIPKGGNGGSAGGPVKGVPGQRYSYNVKAGSEVVDDPDIEIET
jgi:hypothetical protein